MILVYLLTAIILIVAVGAAANILGELITKK